MDRGCRGCVVSTRRRSVFIPDIRSATFKVFLWREDFAASPGGVLNHGFHRWARIIPANSRESYRLDSSSEIVSATTEGTKRTIQPAGRRRSHVIVTGTIRAHPSHPWSIFLVPAPPGWVIRGLFSRCVACPCERSRRRKRRDLRRRPHISAHQCHPWSNLHRLRRRCVGCTAALLCP
jgi:hypothetical protein